MRKKRVWFLIVAVLLAFSLFLIPLVSADFELGNYSLEKVYGPEDSIEGWLNISFENEAGDSEIPKDELNSVLEPYSCGEDDGSYGDSGECWYHITCMCYWDDGVCEAKTNQTIREGDNYYTEDNLPWNISEICNSQNPPELGDCYFDFTVIDKCDTTGFIERIWSVSWTGTKPDWCKDGSDERACISKTLLGFFDTISLIIAILIIIIFYLIVIKKKKKYRGIKRKK